MSRVTTCGADGDPDIRTIGVEEEFLIVDPRTGKTVPAVDDLLSAASRARPATRSRTVLEHEMKREQIEAVSPPCRSIEELAREVLAGRRLADRAARGIGLRIAASGTDASGESSHLSSAPRYRSIAQRFQLTATEQLTCGLHVHVSIADEEEGVAVIDRIRPWLAVVLALSSNSPVWSGVDSGFSSYRYQAWARWPSSGPFEVFGSAAAYRRLVDGMIASGVLLDEGMVYFDARLGAHSPTIEIRVADVCLLASHTVGIAALVRGLVDTAAAEWRRGVPADPLPAALARMAMWTASRHGLEQTLIHPVSGEPAPAGAAVAALLDHVAPALSAAGDLDVVRAFVGEITRNGTGAARQRALLRAGAPLERLVREVTELTSSAQ